MAIRSGAISTPPHNSRWTSGAVPFLAIVAIQGAVAGSDTGCPPDTANAGVTADMARASAVAQTAKVLAGKGNLL
ncbi:hypothetical protein GCM10023214_27770 [Amycolatopsis dongchuanensis]|uniref:Uncharacterized protein n=1 Tax=Amycolatopsis dongchuanensis TaxID=1070866 RepID=A0ABP9QHL2_9PSEU